MMTVAAGAVLWIIIMSSFSCCSGVSWTFPRRSSCCLTARYAVWQQALAPLRLRGGRSPRSMPALAERRSRRAAEAPSSSSSEPPLNTQAGDMDSEAEESREDEEELQTTEGQGTNDEESRSGTRIEDWDASHGSDDGGSGPSTGEDASEFVMRLRRSNSPQGSLIATRIARVASSRSRTSPRVDPDVQGVNSGGGRGGGGQQMWRLVFADSTEHGDAEAPYNASSIFRRRSRRRARQREGLGGDAGSAADLAPSHEDTDAGVDAGNLARALRAQNSTWEVDTVGRTTRGAEAWDGAGEAGVVTPWPASEGVNASSRIARADPQHLQTTHVADPAHRRRMQENNTYILVQGVPSVSQVKKILVGAPDVSACQDAISVDDDTPRLHASIATFVYAAVSARARREHGQADDAAVEAGVGGGGEQGSEGEGRRASARRGGRDGADRCRRLRDGGGVRVAVWCSPQLASAQTGERLLADLSSLDDAPQGDPAECFEISVKAKERERAKERVKLAWALRARGWGNWEGHSSERLRGVSETELHEHGVESRRAVQARVSRWLQRLESMLEGYLVVVVANDLMVLEALRLLTGAHQILLNPCEQSRPSWSAPG